MDNLIILSVILGIATVVAMANHMDNVMNKGGNKSIVTVVVMVMTPVFMALGTTIMWYGTLQLVG